MAPDVPFNIICQNNMKYILLAQNILTNKIITKLKQREI